MPLMYRRRSSFELVFPCSTHEVSFGVSLSSFSLGHYNPIQSKVPQRWWACLHHFSCSLMRMVKSYVGTSDPLDLLFFQSVQIVWINPKSRSSALNRANTPYLILFSNLLPTCYSSSPQVQTWEAMSSVYQPVRFPSPYFLRLRTYRLIQIRDSHPRRQVRA